MLSEEQAIEKLKKIKEDTIKANECGLSNNDFKEEIEVYDTILNLITKLKKENEHWKNGFERELEDNRKNTCELLKQDLIIREKDKQIDLMAEFINNIQDCPLENCGINLDCENKCNNDDEHIKQCWIKYFEKLAKEKGELK